MIKNSYDKNDVTMLIKDLTGKVVPVSVAEKDKRVEERK